MINIDDLKQMTNDAIEEARKLPKQEDIYEDYRRKTYHRVMNFLDENLIRAAKAGKHELCAFGWDDEGKERFYILADELEIEFRKMGFSIRRENSKTVSYMKHLYISWD